MHIKQLKTLHKDLAVRYSPLGNCSVSCAPCALGREGGRSEQEVGQRVLAWKSLAAASPSANVSTCNPCLHSPPLPLKHSQPLPPSSHLPPDHS